MPEYIDTSIQLSPAGQGGRQTPVSPPTGRYLPHLRVGSRGENLGVRLVDGPPELWPGESADATWELLYEGVDYSPLQPGATFTILEGARPIGSGTVLHRWVLEPIAHFHVHDTFVLSSRNLFVVRGVVSKGNVQSGYRVALPSGLEMPVSGVEYVRLAGGAEEVALTFQYAQSTQLEAWQRIYQEGAILQLVGP